MIFEETEEFINQPVFGLVTANSLFAKSHSVDQLIPHYQKYCLFTVILVKSKERQET